jgi:transaldolase
LIPSINDLKVKLFADGADLEGMVKMASLSHISGLTTNPTLMKKAGITDYTKFAREVLGEISLKEKKLLRGGTMYMSKYQLQIHVGKQQSL